MTYLEFGLVLSTLVYLLSTPKTLDFIELLGIFRHIDR